MYQEQEVHKISYEEKTEKRMEEKPSRIERKKETQNKEEERQQKAVGYLTTPPQQPSLTLPPKAEEVNIPSKEKLLQELEELSNTLNARMYNAANQLVSQVPVRDVIKKLNEVRDVRVVIFDGIITQRLVDLAAKQGVRALVGIKTGNVNKIPEGIEVITKL